MKKNIIDYTVTLVVGIAVFLFWFLCHPEALSYQEQNQLFLWTTDYFCNEVKQPGGFADWLGEFIVQFYYIEWLGALLLALLLATLRQLLSSLMKGWGLRLWLREAISILVILTLLYVMGDENVLLSLPIAITFSLCSLLLTRRCRWWTDLFLVPFIYWLIGPVVWLYVIVRLCCRWKAVKLIIPVLLLTLQFALAYTVLDQWPMVKVMTGLGYYRNPYYTFEQFSFGYDKDKYALLRQDWQIRHERWNDLIADAEDYQPQCTFSSNAVNLALAMTGQFADRQFSFYQSGPDALIMPMIRDNMSNLPSMETFYRLGMVNESMRYAFDLQESILNGRKSGRLMKRIAECCIINGRYATASKYLDLLSQSLFYAKWAKKAKSYLGNEAWINGHEEWGRIRRMRYKDDFIYNYNELDKMFGILYQDNHENKMALEYFLGQMLLLGNVQGFGQYLAWAQQSGFYQSMPMGYQDVAKCVQMQGNAPGSRYGEYIKRISKGNATDAATGASMQTH